MILIVDDDKVIRMSLGMLLKREGFETVAAANAEEALAVVRREPLQLIIMDMNYTRETSGEEGLELLMKVKIFQPAVPVILITAWGSIPLAVEGMKAGAFDFITKPWNNYFLMQRIRTAISLNAGEPEAEEETAEFDRAGIVGSSPELMAVLDTVRRVAPTDAPVLITGENGTGKELIARALHLNSPRRREQMVTVNLGGISQSLFESEMFGHVKGAFTGATANRKGRFEMAHKGTIFLDEIGDLDINCQVKLLRVLQEHTYERLGDSAPRTTDVRAVCATNADLPSMVAARTFREDLYYRINLITVTLPPLRDRVDDIPLLVDHFVGRHCEATGRQRPAIAPDAMDFLKTLPYPGNIRELKNLVERTLLVTPRESLTAADFRGQYDGPAAVSRPAASSLESKERQSIETALAQTGGNLTRAAGLLGISRQALYRRMEKYEITP